MSNPCEICIIKIMCQDPCDKFIYYNTNIIEGYLDDVNYDHSEAVMYNLSRRIRYDPFGVKTISLFYGNVIKYFELHVRHGEIILVKQYSENHRIGEY